MDNKTQVPIGTKLNVLKANKIVILNEIVHYPTRYKTIDESNKIEYYRTHEVEVIETKE